MISLLRRSLILFAVGVVILSGSLFAPILSTSAHAATASNWQAGSIIDDGIFYDGNDWSADQIQQFLNNLVPNCDTWGAQASEYGGGTRAQYGASRGYPAPYICLRNYYENPTTHENNLTITAGQLAPTPSGAVSAAQIIKAAATTYGISVRALLVLLHKESAGPLTTDAWPFPNQYRNAMGYGCPDTAPCDPNYAGFYNQVTNAARQFKIYRENPTNYRHVAQQNNSVLYNPVSSCGSSTVFIKTTATAGLYNYTPYQPNASALANLYGTGDACSAYGNRNFWRVFTDWFGNPLLPAFYKTPGSSAVYLQTGGYKFFVPSMAILQDYGVNPSSIATISQDLSDAIPVAPITSGLSNKLGYIVKSPSDTDSDGATVYLVSLGRKHPVPSMAMFADYGLSASSISYLPLSYLQTLATDASLTNFIRTPSGAIMQVKNSVKKLIFDSSMYSSLAQGTYSVLVSDATASLIPTANPLTTNPVVVKSSDSDIVYAYDGTVYRAFPDMSTFRCWGVNTKSQLALNVVSQSYLPNNITPSSNLSCLSNDPSANTLYLFSENVRYRVPAAYGFSASSPLPSSLAYLYGAIPIANSPLPQTIKGSSPGVWFLENGARKPIPSLSNLQLLGLLDKVSIVDDSSISAFPQSGIKLGTGQVVKSTDSGAVYAISDGSRILIPSADSFVGHHYKWSHIETYSQALLDASYPVNSSPLRDFYTDPTTRTTYAIGPTTCYVIPESLISTYNQSAVTNIAQQPYSTALFPGLSIGQCTGKVTPYIKSISSSTVYELRNATKYPISSWASLLRLNGGAAPDITILSDNAIGSYPTGTTL